MRKKVRLDEKGNEIIVPRFPDDRSFASNLVTGLIAAETPNSHTQNPQGYEGLLLHGAPEHILDRVREEAQRELEKRGENYRVMQKTDECYTPDTKLMGVDVGAFISPTEYTPESSQQRV